MLTICGARDGGDSPLFSLFFRGRMIWRDIQYFFHIIFFSYTFFFIALNHPVEATGMSRKKERNSVIVCARILFQTVDMCYKFFFPLPLLLLLCIINNNKRGRANDGTDTQPDRNTKKYIIFVRRRGNKLKRAFIANWKVLGLGNIDVMLGESLLSQNIDWFLMMLSFKGESQEISLCRNQSLPENY